MRTVRPLAVMVAALVAAAIAIAIAVHLDRRAAAGTPIPGSTTTSPPRAGGDPARIWAGTANPVLRLITCGGAFDRHAGSYLDNIIGYADQLVT